MKFLVDEMPYWYDDCPFFNKETEQCEVDNKDCLYIRNNPAGYRQEEDCQWLTTPKGVM